MHSVAEKEQSPSERSLITEWSSCWGTWEEIPSPTEGGLI